MMVRNQFMDELIEKCLLAYAQYLLYLPDGESEELEISLAIHDAYFQTLLKYIERGVN